MSTLKRRGTPQGDKKEYENLANGEYEGRLTYVADLGMQAREYKGEVKSPCQQLSLGIEILGEHVKIGEEEVPRVLWTKPFNIYFVMNEKGNEFKLYRVFDSTAQEGEEADWDSVLGTPCSVVVGKDAKTNTYDEIVTLNPIPAKYRKDVAAGELDPAIGDADDMDNPANKAMFGLVKYVYDKRILDVDIPF